MPIPANQTSNLLSGYRAAKEQEALKKKHGINSPEVVVIEKKSALAQIWRSTLAAIFLSIRILATIALVLLALVGLSVFIYPDLRSSFMVVFEDTVVQIQNFLGI